jgi:integrase/recombinase XerD
MREKGLKATGCNSTIRAINAYLHWASPEDAQKCSPQCKHPRITELKEPDIVLPTFSAQEIKRLVKWKPKGFIRGGYISSCCSCLIRASNYEEAG